MADLLKSAVRLTFPKGARLDDPTKLFNSRLDSGTVRAIDYLEDSLVDDASLRHLIARPSRRIEGAKRTRAWPVRMLACPD